MLCSTPSTTGPAKCLLPDASSRMSALSFRHTLSTPMLMWAFVLPKGLAIYLLAVPKGPVGYVSAVLVYSIGLCIQNGMLTSEFVRKTQLETDQIASLLISA